MTSVLPRPRRSALALVASSMLLAAAAAADVVPPAGGGAAITDELARGLFERVALLDEDDGCAITRFDTSRFYIAVGLRAPSGTDYDLYVTTAPPRDPEVDRRAGGWTFAADEAVRAECGATVAGLERVLADAETPLDSPWSEGRWTAVHENYALIGVSFVLLLVWTARILWREARRAAPPGGAVAALAATTAAAWGLRLSISPRTFLHEFYHVAETLRGHLTGQAGPVYGDTGPALFQLAGWLSGRPDDVQSIFLANAAIASLAVPAVALLDLALFGNWVRALCAAVLLCVLPQHLRFSASEVLFIPAVTFAFWALGLAVLYLRTRRLEDALCAAVAMSIAIQTRPEMHFLPLVLLGLVLLTRPRSLGALFDWRSGAALLVLAALLIPRFFEIAQILQSDNVPAHVPPTLHRLWHSAVLFQPEITPPPYWIVLGAGALWTVFRRPGLLLWTAMVVAGFAAFSLSSGDNPPYNVRSQLLPNSFTVLVAAGCAPLWVAIWGRRRRLAIGAGALLLAAMAIGVVATARGFITRVGDQQLEWEFLERTIPRLPERATLLTTVGIGRNLDAFPEFLLARAGKRYRLIDLQQAQRGEVPWPAPGPNVLYYQGMFCHFAADELTQLTPMTAPCNAVQRRYSAEPLFVEDLDTEGYSALRYAPAPFRIGFYRLRERPAAEPLQAGH